MAEITLRNIVKRYGDGFPAVNVEDKNGAATRINSTHRSSLRKKGRPPTLYRIRTVSW